MLIAEGFSPTVGEGEMANFSLRLGDGQAPGPSSIKIYAQRTVKGANVYFIKLILMQAGWIAHSQAMF